MSLEGAMIGVTYVTNGQNAAGDMLVFDAPAGQHQIFLRLARMHLAGNRKFVPRGSCVRITGSGIYDLVIEHVWAYGAAEDGVYIEQTWGSNLYNLICEYNGRDGLHVERNAFETVVEGPKITHSKMVHNGRHGVYLGRYIYDSLITTTEMAGGAAGAGYGLYIDRGRGHQVTNCRFVSNENGCSGGVALDACSQCDVSHSSFRSLATLRCPVGVYAMANTTRNVISGNTFDMAVGDVAVRDVTGRNTISDNPGYPARSSGVITKPHDTGSLRRITVAHGLGQPMPAATSIVCRLTPANEAASKMDWWVDATDQTYIYIRSASDMADTVLYKFHLVSEYCNREAAPI